MILNNFEWPNNPASHRYLITRTDGSNKTLDGGGTAVNNVPVFD